MNKNDFKLIVIILTITFLLFIYYFANKQPANQALVYHNSELILTIDLSIDATYEVMGDNGPVIIRVLKNQIKVEQENSPYHLCSKQGYISEANETIICLPNRIIIELPKDNTLDTEVK